MIDEITSEILTKQILLFRDFLVKSWSTLDALMKNHDWHDDGSFTLQWIQVNWEFLVERELLGKGKYLTPLATRLDDNQFDFSVVTYLEKDVINIRDKKKIAKGTRLRLIGFTKQHTKGGFGIYPPFDIATLVIDEKRKEIVAFPIDELKFTLESFDPNYFK